MERKRRGSGERAVAGSEEEKLEGGEPCYEEAGGAAEVDGGKLEREEEEDEDDRSDGEEAGWAGIEEFGGGVAVTERNKDG